MNDNRSHSTFSPQKRIPVTILGATGVVGQRFLRRIADHPWFYPAFLAASDRSAGKKYSEACQWHLSGLPYAGYGDMTVAPCAPEAAFSPIVFSALDTSPARDIEPLFAAAGAYVFSNASAFRMDEDVPLLIPELNPDHFALLPVQQAKRGWRGAIVTNPNCTTVMLAAPLAALQARFGLDAVMVTSMQAISGAGYPGVPALDIVGNVIPYIRNEESKVESESNKILGTLVRNGSAASVVPAPFVVSATCTRVPVIDGHTLTISVRLKTKASLEDLVDAFRTFEPKTAAYDLPSAPSRFLALLDAEDRPQPRKDVEEDGGMRITVGRLRTCSILDFKFVSLGHNTERGAAGASVLNAETALAMGFVPSTVPGELR
ncbi:MAG: aspartate-semialdehyde dehydrogenase [Rectinema sp.]